MSFPIGTAAVINVENASFRTLSQADVTNPTIFSMIYLAIGKFKIFLSISLVNNVLLNNLNTASKIPSDLLNNS